ncbi:conserved hypothetical protein, partial [Ricinus communis]
MVDHQEQHRIGGTQRDFNTRYAGGLSSSTFPANWSQGDLAGNPAGPDCTTGSHLVPSSGGQCKMTTSSFVDYIPKSERTTGLVKGTFKINENHELGIELLSTQSKVQSAIAPVPYGNLYINRLRPDGTANPYYPKAAGLDPTYTDDDLVAAGAQPGAVVARWRDLPNGSRADENINKQQRLVVSMTGTLAGWDYTGALSYNENKVKENLYGYSDGGMITQGVLNGVINTFGEQDAAGTDLLQRAALNGNIQNAKGTSKGADIKLSREVCDWLNTGHQAAWRSAR